MMRQRSAVSRDTSAASSLCSTSYPPLAPPRSPRCERQHRNLSRPAAAHDAALLVPGEHVVSRRGAAALLLALPMVQAFPNIVQAEETADLVFFDIKIEGQPAGRIIVQLFTSEVPAGAQRFRELAEERGGVGYRLSKFIGVYPTYLKNGGVASLSYSADQSSPITGGESLAELEKELEQQTRQHDQAGLVSLVVREAVDRPVKDRLVAVGGKLITVQEQAGEAPNGTQWCLTREAAPALDATNLIVGKVVSGMDGAIAAIAALPINKPQYDNPYFMAGKSMGDKRAVVAEKAFYRPLKRVLVSGCGVVV